MASSQNLAGLAALAALGAGLYNQSKQQQTQMPSPGPAPVNPQQSLQNPMYQDYSPTGGDTGIGQAGTTMISRPGQPMVSQPTPYQAPGLPLPPAQMRTANDVQNAARSQAQNAARLQAAQNLIQQQLANSRERNLGDQGYPRLTQAQLDAINTGNTPQESFRTSEIRGEGAYQRPTNNRALGRDNLAILRNQLNTATPEQEQRNADAEKYQEQMLEESRQRNMSRDQRVKQALDKAKKLRSDYDKQKASKFKFDMDSSKPYKKGGTSKKMAKGGTTSTMASKRGDGIASKGKTKGRFV